MKAGWKTVRLGEILTERREIPSADDLAFGRVPVVAKIRFDTGKMELRQNAKTSTGMIMARPGDLLISGINAAKGAIAICDAKNSSPVAATIHYSAYSSKEHLVDRRYLWLFLRSRNFQELLQQHIPGGIKTELKAKRLLPIPIPLPPLPEQRRIVARIEKLVEKIDTANELHKKSAEDAK